jgi:ankyrin repeat protein
VNIKLYFNGLNNWVNPCSKDYKNAVKNFNEFGSLGKVITVAVSIFCGLAFVVGGFAAFRGIVSWLYPGNNSEADKVDGTIENKQYFLPFHPAERSTGFDHISTLPDEILLKIIGYLDEGSLCNIDVASQRLLNISIEAWECLVKKRIGSTVATQLKQSRHSWKEVIVDLNRPIVASFNTLSFLSVPDNSWGDKPELKILFNHIRENDNVALEKALVHIKAIGKLKELNSRHFENSTLEIAAICGHVENVRLLIKYGAQDALYGQHFCSEDGVGGMSALFYAASFGMVEMTKFLLKNGAKPNLNLELNGFNYPFISTLIRRIQSESANILECLLSLINAWKGKVGHETVCQHKDAKIAFEIAIEKGYANVANLLFALGIRIDLSEDLINRSVYQAIIKKNLEMIKFLHVKGLVDLRNLKSISDKTLLHIAFALNAHEILQYLIAEVKIPVDVCNSKGETYSVSGKKELECNIRRAIAHELETFAGFFDKISCLRIESLEECLKQRVDLNVPINDKGQTLLHLAVKKILAHRRNEENGTIISQLLKSGANPYIKDKKGRTPLQNALKVISEAKEDEGGFYNHQDKLSAEILIKEMQELK